MVNLSKVGKIVLNNYGNSAIITKESDLKYEVEFMDDFKHKQWFYKYRISEGIFKNPYNPARCGLGYMGIGENKSSENGKKTKEYYIWSSMLNRCYSEIFYNQSEFCKKYGISNTGLNSCINGTGKTVSGWKVKEVGFDV